MMKRRMLVRTAVLSASIALAGWLLWWVLAPDAVMVDWATIERGRLAVTVEDDGTTRIRERYIVSSPLGGRLLRISLREGDPVASGETLLARIEPTDPELLDARTLAEAEARVKAAEAAWKLTEPLVAQAKAALDYAQSELYRITKLNEDGAASNSQLDEAKLRYRTRQEDYRIARYRRDIAHFELEQSKAALVRTRPKPGDSERSDDRVDDGDESVYFDIRSPVNGRVLHILQKSATVVSPGTPLMELGDPADLEIIVDVLSTDAVKIRRGNRVAITNWGGEYDLIGEVRRVEPSGFTKISALGIEEQRVNVVIDLRDPRERWSSLGDGFHVDAKITVWEVVDVPTVPLAAVFRNNDRWAVFVIRNGRAVLRHVKLGRRNSEAARVMSGLEAGDIVVLYPGASIDDGTPVVRR